MQKKKMPIDTRAINGKTVFSRKRGILTILGGADFSNMYVKV
jgi:hypothetical protein